MIIKNILIGYMSQEKTQYLCDLLQDKQKTCGTARATIKSLKDKVGQNGGSVYDKLCQFTGESESVATDKEYVHISKVKQLASILLANANKNDKCPPGDITKHPQYKDLIKKYAMKIEGNPPKYVPCAGVRRLSDVPIQEHPDFKNYVKKEDYIIMTGKVSKAKKIIAEQQATINKLKEQLQ